MRQWFNVSLGCLHEIFPAEGFVLQLVDALTHQHIDGSLLPYFFSHKVCYSKPGSNSIV